MALAAAKMEVGEESLKNKTKPRDFNCNVISRWISKCFCNGKRYFRSAVFLQLDITYDRRKRDGVLETRMQQVAAQMSAIFFVEKQLFLRNTWADIQLDTTRGENELA